MGEPTTNDELDAEQWTAPKVAEAAAGGDLLVLGGAGLIAAAVAYFLGRRGRARN
jgi:hypothetical protein